MHHEIMSTIIGSFVDAFYKLAFFTLLSYCVKNMLSLYSAMAQVMVKIFELDTTYMFIS